ncbi:MAG: hypothetical protein N2169_05225 [bacterium]|nr:hypothetical protein [bacterium]
MSKAHQLSIISDIKYIMTNDSTMFINHGNLFYINGHNCIFDEITGKNYMLPQGDYYYPTMSGKVVDPDYINTNNFINFKYLMLDYNQSMTNVPGFALALPYEPKTIFFVYKTLNSLSSNKPILMLKQDDIDGKITLNQNTEGGLHTELTINYGSVVYTIGTGTDINDMNPHTISVEINRISSIGNQTNFIIRLIIDGKIEGYYEYNKDRSYMPIPKKIAFGFTDTLIGASAEFSEIRIDGQNYSDEEILQWHYSTLPFLNGNNNIVIAY